MRFGCVIRRFKDSGVRGHTDKKRDSAPPLITGVRLAAKVAHHTPHRVVFAAICDVGANSRRLSMAADGRAVIDERGVSFLRSSISFPASADS